MPKVEMQSLKDFGAQLLVSKGVGEETARYVAEVAVTTEAAGVHTHGVVIFGAYDRMLGDAVNAAAQPKIVNERGATALIDGNKALSHLAMKIASDLAVKKAREHGVAMIGVRNANWLGGLGAFILPLVQQGFFVQFWAQSSQCRDSAPYGGVDARFSTNPVALGFPTPDGPMIADFSTAIMSMGKANTMIKQGEKAPGPAFFDKDGNVTDDPAVMKDGGAMFLMGGEMNGFKGYAFALWSEALTAMAGGSCNNPALDQRQSFNLTVIDPEAFGGMDYYRQEMARFVSHIKSSRVRDGFDAIRLPGERMLSQVAESEKSGVELSEDMLNTLNELADRNGIEPAQVIG
jgi:LDH2 family malate/lactate/ureidoglycolate dehydrogenase